MYVIKENITITKITSSLDFVKIYIFFNYYYYLLINYCPKVILLRYQ